MVDIIRRLTSFTISEKKRIIFEIDGKKIVFEIPFVLGVNPEHKRLYIGESFEFAVDLSFNDIEKILEGNESIIESVCKQFAWERILKSKFCKGYAYHED